jgi:hypothetical protein
VKRKKGRRKVEVRGKEKDKGEDKYIRKRIRRGESKRRER